MKNNRPFIKLFAICFASLAAQPLFAQPNTVTKNTMSTAPGTATSTETVKATATVVGIDKANRKITLKQPDGQIVNMTAGDQVRNFDQLALGDVVSAEYTRALSLDLKKNTAGIRSRTERPILKRSAEGERPGGTVGNEVTVVADVVDVNSQDQRVTLRGPEGRMVTVQVQDPQQLKNIQRGDQVQATYTESLAVAVIPQSSSMGSSGTSGSSDSSGK